MTGLTLERLHEMLSYDPETGVFTRLVGRSGPHAGVGDIAGWNDGSGYRRITIDGKRYKAHRLAWFYAHGDWPTEIDHINGDRSGNRLSNLRDVARPQNAMNRAVYRSNTSGLRGVSFYRRSGKWKSQIQVAGKKVGLGYFDSPEAAHAAYVEAAGRLHGEFARVD